MSNYNCTSGMYDVPDLRCNFQVTKKQGRTEIGKKKNELHSWMGLVVTQLNGNVFLLRNIHPMWLKEADFVLQHSNGSSRMLKSLILGVNHSELQHCPHNVKGHLEGQKKQFIPRILFHIDCFVCVAYFHTFKFRKTIWKGKCSLNCGCIYSPA